MPDPLLGMGGVEGIAVCKHSLCPYGTSVQRWRTDKNMVWRVVVSAQCPMKQGQGLLLQDVFSDCLIFEQGPEGQEGGGRFGRVPGEGTGPKGRACWVVLEARVAGRQRGGGGTLEATLRTSALIGWYKELLKILEESEGSSHRR